MQNKFKALFTLALVATAAQASKEQHFSSGVGVTVGAGVTTAGTKGNNGAGGAISGLTGYKSATAAVAGRAGRPGVPAVPAVPAAVNNIGRPNNFVDFTSPASVKNSSGFAFVGGLFAQHVSQSGFTMGGRWLFGRSGASSTLTYNSGPLLLDDKASPRAANMNATLDVSANDTQAFRLKDKWFTAVIAELGYTAGRMQFYVGPGVAFHRQKLSCVNSSGKVAAGLTKTVTSPMFALGTRFAMSKRVSIGVEWQRHIGGKKTWNNVSKIAPENMQSFGAPTTKMNNNLFLVNMNYVFGGK